MTAPKCINGTWLPSKMCQEFPDSLQNPIFAGYIPTALGGIGIVFNILTILVLRNINRKNPITRLVMILIAVSDSVEILNYVLDECFRHIFTDYHRDSFQIFRHGNLYWSVPFQSMTMTFNRWLVLILTCSSWAIMKDATNLRQYDKRRQQKRLKKVIVAIVILGVLSILAGIPLIHHFEYVECQSWRAVDGKGIRAEVPLDACHPAYLWGYLAGFAIAANTLLPAVLQILMNAYIITVLIGLKKKKTGGNVVTSGKQDKENRVILMCSTVAVVYLALQIPYIISSVETTRETIISCQIKQCQAEYCACHLKGQQNCSDYQLSILQTGCYKAHDNNYNENGGSLAGRIRPIATWGLILNCSINIFIYIATSPNFKKELYYILHLDHIQELVTNSRSSGCPSSGTGGTAETALPQGNQEEIRMQSLSS